MFAILFEVLLIEIQEEIDRFAGWEGGGLRGTKIVNKNFVNKLAFPKHVLFPIWLLTLSMPHVRGCLKTSSQDDCVWSDPLHSQLRKKKPPKLQYESATPQPFYSLVFLESGGFTFGQPEQKKFIFHNLESFTRQGLPPSRVKGGQSTNSRAYSLYIMFFCLQFSPICPDRYRPLGPCMCGELKDQEAFGAIVRVFLFRLSAIPIKMSQHCLFLSIKKANKCFEFYSLRAALGFLVEALVA